ncbi:MAG: AmmeMemoRadiSam system protein B, partial [Planctomycetes bacterium]|nr:AmmeMemoRadiSam system protein B [Planctomycetota bacterium]
LLHEACSLAQIRQSEGTQLFSLRVQSTRARLEVDLSARRDETQKANPALASTTREPTIPSSKHSKFPETRPPAVAGRFYPSDVKQISVDLDRILEVSSLRDESVTISGSIDIVRGTVGAMVPHAGWIYSGRLAAKVLKQIELPQRIIVIGPKHTPMGKDWAVAPHRIWSFPGGELDSDFEFTRRLVDSVRGLNLDAAAHEKEHGIEVQLPIIHRLSPDSKVIGICVSRANLDQCDQFASDLSAVIRELDDPPLLLISSDMNHFASDAETRRRDALALADFDRLDEDALFHTCRTNDISMCGLIPAVIVIKTLEKLVRLNQSLPVGYATSAEASGDTRRCVGYAGRLLVENSTN